jgi:hypothetical protein
MSSGLFQNFRYQINLLQGSLFVDHLRQLVADRGLIYHKKRLIASTKEFSPLIMIPGGRAHSTWSIVNLLRQPLDLPAHQIGLQKRSSVAPDSPLKAWRKQVTVLPFHSMPKATTTSS